MNELSIDAAVAQLCALLGPTAAISRISPDSPTSPFSPHAPMPTSAPVEAVAIVQAAGRVLARPVVARIDLPAFDNSAMDGYALRAADLNTAPLREIGHSYAGHRFSGRVQAGQCVRIMTGAPVPEGADTVVALEDTTRTEAGVQVLRSPGAGANIRRRGEHVQCGDSVLQPGCHLGPVEAGLAASVGASSLTVIRRLQVGVASTGDELADAPLPLSDAGSYDANRPLLLASLARLGLSGHDLGICADDATAFTALIDLAFAQNLDALVVTGGAAQGDADVVRQAVDVQFLPLQIRPGRGLAYAVIERAGRRLALLGLPGNAVATFVMFHLVARRVLLHLAGAAAQPLPHLQLPLEHEASTRRGHVDYRRGRIVTKDDRATIELLAEQGSSMLRTVVQADALVAIGPAAHTPAGALVSVIPLGLL